MEKTKIKPPKLMEKLLERFLEPSTRYSAIGDFSEMYNYYTENRSLLYAKFWFWVQIPAGLPSWFLVYAAGLGVPTTTSFSPWPVLLARYSPSPTTGRRLDWDAAYWTYENR